MLTCDTSGLVALLVSGDRHHRAAVAMLRRDPGPYMVPVAILAETTFVTERRGGATAVDALLADLEHGAYTPDCGTSDWARIRALVARYDDLPLGFADAAVIACAQRHGGVVLTLDRRDFDVVAADAGIRVVP
ncbi:MAG TPA: PIN domain-containing protein [Verrucomicrobiae bacterium]|nr:PIN domain-containing protein [Verrucomicrobiae bacterium]